MHTNAIDELFIDASPVHVYRCLFHPADWWPGARVEKTDTRIAVSAPGFRPMTRVRFAGAIEHIRVDEGVVWQLDRGELHGRAEFWLEPFRDGTIVHYFLDVTPGDRGRYRRWSSRVRRHRWAVRRGLNALKERLEGR